MVAPLRWAWIGWTLAGAPVLAQSATPVIAFLGVQDAPGVAPGAATDISVRIQELTSQWSTARVMSTDSVVGALGEALHQNLVQAANNPAAVMDTDSVPLLATHVLVGRLEKPGEATWLHLRLLELSSSLLVAANSERLWEVSGDRVDDALLRMVTQLLSAASLSQPVSAPARAEVGPCAPPAATAAPAGRASAVRWLLLGGGGASVVVAAAAVLAGMVSVAVAGTWALALYNVAGLMAATPAWGPSHDGSIYARLFGLPAVLVGGSLVLLALSAALGVGGLSAAGAGLVFNP